ncbi:MAG: GTPase Obg [bacterium ADurb.Bin429]|nr:MAG: GTPase Obg [bacterium ADurb.Bin429]
MQPLLYAIDEILRQQEEAEAPVETPETVTVPRVRRELEIARLDEHLWEVTGSGIERLIAMTDMTSEEGVRRLQTSLERMGLFAMLRERGVQEGDFVRIRGIELEYTE